MNPGDLLAEQLEGTRDWTKRLIADLRDADWTYQPAPGLAHALWTCGHLAVAQNLLVHVRCLSQSILPDDFAACFPIGGPVPAARERDYPAVDVVLREMDRVHAATVTTVRKMPAALLREPAFGKDGAPHPHYKDKFGAVSHCDRHEAFHAGQIALIRRLLGKSFLR